MTVGDIITSVRLCFDEEKSGDANFANASGNDTASMDSIIKSKIGDAARWVCLYSPTELLEGTDTSGTATGILVDASVSPTAITGSTSGGYVDMPGNFIKLCRIRVTGWHRAVRTPIDEDSDEYLQLYDSNGAAATADRPQAVTVERATRRIEVWPKGTTAEYTYVAAVDKSVASNAPESTPVALPPRVKTAFIYYLAFLTLSAYGDARAPRMLEIAKMNIGKQ